MQASSSLSSKKEDVDAAAPSTTCRVPFKKMNGLGNDFVVIDSRIETHHLSAAMLTRIADRKRGIGCDQVIVLERSTVADAFMRIFNPDASEAGACGNATRCIAAVLALEKSSCDVRIETRAGVVVATLNRDGSVTADMGVPALSWQKIPLSRDVGDTSRFLYERPNWKAFAGVVNVGNPHCVFWVDDFDAVDIAGVGPQVEVDELFPQRANVSFVQVMRRDAIKLRVWERGTGLTQACGTAACASTVACIRAGKTDRRVCVSQQGGDLFVEWRKEDDHVLMTGPWTLDFTGCMESQLFSGL